MICYDNEDDRLNLLDMPDFATVDKVNNQDGRLETNMSDLPSFTASVLGGRILGIGDAKGFRDDASDIVSTVSGLRRYY